MLEGSVAAKGRDMGTPDVYKRQVLVFVEKHMRVTFAVRCADGWESGDQLECRDGEIAEFRHIAGAFFGMIIKHEVEQQVALLGDGCELRTVVYAHAVSEFAVFLRCV